jgi:predicted ATPase
VRFAVSGSHGTGKSTLIAGFLERRPAYVHEPEAFETIGDDVDLTESGGVTAEGLRALLEYTVSTIASHAADAGVVFERSPVDYLAYARAARESWPAGEADDFLATCIPRVRSALGHLDLIAYVPVSPLIRPRDEVDPRMRRRVDRCLRRALLDDEYDLFEGSDRPVILELPADPGSRLSELLQHVPTRSGTS